MGREEISRRPRAIRAAREGCLTSDDNGDEILWGRKFDKFPRVAGGARRENRYDVIALLAGIRPIYSRGGDWLPSFSNSNADAAAGAQCGMLS